MRAVLALAVCALAYAAEPLPPKQPLPFSHKQHVGAGLQCKDCHANPDPGEEEGFPATSKCMACHIAIDKNAPAIKELKAYADRKQEIPWARVWEIPSSVSFSHRTHIEAGATCQTCHGPVQDRDVLRRETDMSMGACINCHRLNRAPVECKTCHADAQ